MVCLHNTAFQNKLMDCVLEFYLWLWTAHLWMPKAKMFVDENSASSAVTQAKIHLYHCYSKVSIFVIYCLELQAALYKRFAAIVCSSV